MKSKKEVSATKKAQSWDSYSNSEKGREFPEWTLAQRCLDGTASEQEYNSLDRCYASYVGDVFTYVGPSFGPLTITGSNALKAWNRVNGS